MRWFSFVDTWERLHSILSLSRTFVEETTIVDELMDKLVANFALSKTCAISSGLEAVDLKLIRLDESHLGEPVANAMTLITLQLKHLSVFGMFDYSSVASEFLKD